jgi:hypothetical protein
VASNVIAEKPAGVEAVQEVLKDASDKLKADVKGALEEVKAKRSIEQIAALAAQHAHDGQIITPGALVAHNAAEWLAAMNERHTVVGNVGGKCKIVEWVPSELDEGCVIPSRWVNGGSTIPTALTVGGSSSNPARLTSSFARRAEAGSTSGAVGA